MTYLFTDWQAGTVPPKGWDCADAVADGWTKDDLDTFMKLTVQPWTPPNAKPAEKGEEERSAPAGPAAAAKASEPAREAPAPVPAKRENAAPVGVAGLERLPRMFDDVPLGSEVFLASEFKAYLAAALGGPIVKAEGQFWAYGPTAWQEIPDHQLRLATHGFDGIAVGSKGNVKLGKRMIDGIINELGTKSARPDFFEHTTVGVNVLNGTVTIDDMGVVLLSDHDPEDRFRFTINADFNLHTDMHPPEGSLLHRLLYGSFKGDPDTEDKVNLVGEILGAAAFGLATRVKQPKAFTFLGETASNGKSTIAGLPACLLPEGSVSAISPANLGDERRIINLAGKAANVANEISAAGISGEAFKAVVTGDTVEGRDVYRPAFTFKPRAVHVYTANRLPSFNGGLDRGLQRRLVVVQFNRTIPDSEVVPDILDRIKREELELLLGFAIAGAQRLKRNGGYTIPKSSHEALKEWMQLDPVNEWFEIRTSKTSIEPASGWMRTVRLYEDFKEWAKSEGYKENFLPAVNTFGQRLKAMPGVTMKRLNTGPVAVGITLNSSREQTEVF